MKVRIAIYLAIGLVSSVAILNYRSAYSVQVVEAREVIYLTTQKGLLSWTNIVRAKNNVKPLNNDKTLHKSALAKCKDMVRHNYWAHDSPSGKTPWDFMEQVGVNYTTAGENLAYRVSDWSNQGVVTMWMNSPTHRENLLSKNYGKVGFAICKSANFNNEPGTSKIIVQHFTN